MLDREFDDPADLVVVDAALDRRNDRDAQSDLCEPVERPQLLLQQVRLAADDSIGLRFEAVELKVECGPHLVELLQKTIVAGDSLAVGVEHDEANVADLCGANEIDDPRMDGRLAAGKLDEPPGCLRCGRNRRAVCSTSSSVRLNPGAASAKQSGQSMSQALLTSMMPRQACCSWSGHRPQSCGQPRSTFVPYASGIVPGLL